MEKIKWILNQMPKNEDKNLAVMALDNVNQARKFHRSFPQYSVTPLAKLDGMAGQLGLGGLFVKDESYRFGLNAFKVLGGSFAMAKYIAKEMGKDVSEMTYDYLTSKKFRDDFGQATFFTATDGNHGRGVAWAANKLGQKAVVHMPKGSTQTRFDNIAKEGASVTIEELNLGRHAADRQQHFLRKTEPAGVHQQETQRPCEEENYFRGRHRYRTGREWAHRWQGQCRIAHPCGARTVAQRQLWRQWHDRQRLANRP